MAAIRTTTNMILKEIFHHPQLLSSSASSSVSVHNLLPCLSRNFGFVRHHPISFSSIRCAAASDSGGDKKVSSRLSQVQQLLQEAEERASLAGDEPTPKITLGTASSFACYKVYRENVPNENRETSDFNYLSSLLALFWCLYVVFL